ncbi:hypothetical protein ATZ33_14460 [Enterococcus silesiacus]|uniref:OmpR/PhoB-type domain-containing protein n=1 Tax=Enterococcus silesiacus TaxID=332949 RepID=A0A0S3KE42_9ENTE|nr:winged helix-turn-helix domain-containing protein [Enterococcus silesiacus]ALS02536.1 hypothetical protein ATZ33_14460 [Enterococcus silesiacus]OJG93548.1 hypothetical protein RV15_GL000150 [Enterococcus silesiacus]
MKIGLIDSEKKISQSAFTYQAFTYILDSKEVVKEGDLTDIDALIICKNQSFDVGKICEWVMKAKRYRNIPIWIIMSEEQLEEKYIYLQLGVCGIFVTDHIAEEIYLSIGNSLNTINVQPQTELGEKPFIQLNPLMLSLTVGEKSVSLTKLEYSLLAILYENKENVCTYELLSETFLMKLPNMSHEQRQGRVANIICKIRAKLALVDKKMSHLIKTVRSVGYMLILAE